MKKRNLIAVLMSVVLAATSTVDMPTFAAAYQPQEITEQEAVAYLCAELGIDDWDAYIADLAARYHADENNGGTRDTCPFDPDYFIDIYTGGSSNGQVDSLDAMYLLNFLNGQVNYPYVYTDLDPTQDCIVDRADVQALMDCFTMVILLEEYPDFVPGTHGEASSETARSYRHYNCITETEDSSTYTISIPPNTLNSYVPSIPMQQRGTMEQTFFNCMDPRIICTTGSGVIVGEHCIATNAHCLLNDFTGEFDTSCEAHLLTYPTNDPYNPVNTKLHIISYHVPDEFLQKDLNGNYIPNPNADNKLYFNRAYDYGLIVVQESLAAYGKFDFGLPLSGLSAQLTLMAYPENKNQSNNPNVNMLNGERIRPLTSYGVGTIHSTQPTLLSHTCESKSGSSGGALFTNNMLNSTTYESLIGLHCANQLGVRIMHPLVLFYLNNPMISQDLGVS